MKRSNFLLWAALVALAVGSFALLTPTTLLATKGITSAGANVWAQEVGVFLIATSVTAFLVRHHADSPTLKAILIGNVVVQIGLFVIEVWAFVAGTIPLLSGIIGNSIVHILLATGFGYHAIILRETTAPQANT
jgi:hypothetical protein